MKIHCPTCNALIAAAQLNVATDVAVCLQCEEAYSISALMAATGESDDFDIHRPPRGVSFEGFGGGWRIRATTRSPIAFFLVPFMCVWSGFSLGGIYGSQIASGQFNPLISLFGIPFILGSLLFGSIAVMTVCGKVVIAADRNDGSIFVGVGPIGWTRRFSWDSIRAVEETFCGVRHAGGNGWMISLIGPPRIKFGGMLNDVRREYVVQALRKLLVTSSNHSRMFGAAC